MARSRSKPAAEVDFRDYADARRWFEGQPPGSQGRGPLRRIAENSTQLRWMLSYIDFVIRSNRPQ